MMTFMFTATFSPATSASSINFRFNKSTGTTIIGEPGDGTMILSGGPNAQTFIYTIPVKTEASNAEIIFRGTPSATTTTTSLGGWIRISWIKIA